MVEYPSRWESDVVLADGGTARVRPSRPDDEPALLALYERLSDESIYLRFFSPVPRPTAVQLERITSIDYVDHMVLVAQLGGDIVAVARYDRVAPDEAEVAFAVADDQQRRGLATLLLEHLAGIARERHQHVLGRHAPGQREDAQRLLRRRMARRESIRGGHGQSPLRDRAHEDLARRRRGAREPSRVGVDRSAARAPFDRGDRREPPPGPDRPRAVPQPAAYGFEGPVYPVHPTSVSVAGVRAYASVLEVPDAVDLAIVVVPAADVLAIARNARKRACAG